MNAIARPVAQIAAVAIVLILAAALGLIAGNLLNARDGGLTGGAPGPFANVWGNIAPDGVAAADASTDSPQTWGNVDERRSSRLSDQSSAGTTGPAVPHMGGFDGARYADAAEDVPIGPERWGNIAEDQDAAAESLTAPTPR